MMSPKEPHELGAWSRFFEPVEPLPGGLDALRQRIDQEKARRTRARRWVPVAVAVACAAALAVFLLLPALGPAEPGGLAARRLLAGGPAHPRAVALGIAPRPAPARVADARIAPTDEVVFYWVCATPRPQETEAGPEILDPDAVSL